MARRSAPAKSGPAYVNKNQLQSRRYNDPNESAFSRFLREEVYAPEKLPGNISIVTSVAMFAAGIAAVRAWGEHMVPV